MAERKEKVLIVKAGYSEILDTQRDSRKVSYGDVLRTTPILHLYNDDDVTWVTDKNAFPLLEKNPYIGRLLGLDFLTVEQLKKERFDTVINLEKIPGIGAFLEDVKSVRRYGFLYQPETRTSEAFDKAFEVLAVCTNHHLKKQNQRIAQDLLFEIVGKKWAGEEYVLSYKPKTEEKHDIALNTQIGEKWPTKAWSTKKWDQLEQKLIEEGFDVTRQDKQGPEITQNLYGYIDWINSSRLVISNDSLGMHLGIALRKKVLGLFGATPPKEVHFYERGKAILPEPYPECAPCFEGTCKRGNNCIESINLERVFGEAISLLGNENE